MYGAQVFYIQFNVSAGEDCLPLIREGNRKIPWIQETGPNQTSQILTENMPCDASYL